MAGDGLPPVLGLAQVRALYAGGMTPAELFARLGARIDAADPAVFITRTPDDMIATALAALLARAPEPNSLPLWGVPFAVKDNIDVAGLPTTCACPAFAHTAEADAAAVARLAAAGAIVLGKTNLDQFATGLNGTRSPYGAPHSVFSEAHISGGSSSGSAVAVAAGLACFALGTDTAGSGRVPAALNNIVGIKPTPGLVSTRGMVPACASLDCLSIFALSAADGATVRELVEGYDPADPWSRRSAPSPLPGDGLRVGVLGPADLDLSGSGDNSRLYADAIERAGGEVVEIDYRPFRDTAALLYEGPWVAERQAAFASFGLADDVLDPSVFAILARGRELGAVDAFRGLHALQALRRRCEVEWERVDVLLLPTVPGTFTIADMLAEPLSRNARLGIYTNFCNFLGLAAIAVPAGFDMAGLPFGVTLMAPPFADRALVALADRLHRSAACGAGIARDFPVPACVEPTCVEPTCAMPEADAARVEIGVVGAHLSGMPLNPELLELGGRLVGECLSAPDYRLFVLPDTAPAKPGLVRDPAHSGPGIALEVWSLPVEGFGRFVSRIPAPLGIGRIALADGGEVSGFLAENHAIAGAREITGFGGWRNYVASLSSPGTASVR